MAWLIIAALWYGVFFPRGNLAKKEGRSGAVCFIFSLFSTSSIGFIVVALLKGGEGSLGTACAD